jgi:hypothetical protein
MSFCGIDCLSCLLLLHPGKSSHKLHFFISSFLHFFILLQKALKRHFPQLPNFIYKKLHFRKFVHLNSTLDWYFNCHYLLYSFIPHTVGFSHWMAYLILLVKVIIYIVKLNRRSLFVLILKHSLFNLAL